jgi:hypothetical protein
MVTMQTVLVVIAVYGLLEKAVAHFVIVVRGRSSSMKMRGDRLYLWFGIGVLIAAVINNMIK